MNKIDKRLHFLLGKVKEECKKVKELSDYELKNKTLEFKERLNNGETTDDLLPEAFAVCCEADYRVLGMFPYDVQILGGIALHLCYLCEMNTGEGKTLTATMPLYYIKILVSEQGNAACEKLSNCHNLLIMRNDKKDYRNSQHFAFVF